MEDIFTTGPPEDAGADLWLALGLDAPAVIGRVPALPPDEADDLETVVRRHGGRLPGSDPRR